MRFTVASLFLLIIAVSATSDIENEAQELLAYLFKNSKYLPKITSIPKSEAYPQIGLTGVGTNALVCWIELMFFL